MEHPLPPQTPIDPNDAALERLAPEAAQLIREFMAVSIVKGGASPADIVALYTEPAIVADGAATRYLDRRFVHGEMPDDWRELNDALGLAFMAAPPGVTAADLLVRVQRARDQAERPRSIFDDPEELDEADEDRLAALPAGLPALRDLSDDGRRAIERYILADVFCYGVTPYRSMQLREWLDSGGDQRAIQFLDIQHAIGELPPDWQTLRDRALQLRVRLEQRGTDPAAQFARLESSDSMLDAEALLRLLSSP
ncbi:MAG: hypothetical protein U0821_04865 [Chloroflexota bacterium]